MFLNKEYDFPDFIGQPRVKWLMASCKRTGSTSLAAKCWETGQLGAPAEYSDVGSVLKEIGAWGFTPELQAELIRRRTSPNGVFAGKVIFPRGIENEYPNITHLLYVTRRDEVDRAISEVLINLTKTPWSFSSDWEVPEKFALSYNYPTLVSMVEQQRRQDKAWHQYMGTLTIPKLIVTYEDFDSRTIRTIANFLDVDFNEFLPKVPVPRTYPYKCSFSKEWRERFLQDAKRGNFQVNLND